MNDGFVLLSYNVPLLLGPKSLVWRLKFTSEIPTTRQLLLLHGYAS